MMQTPHLSERDVSILNAAFQAFATYGYRRTAMGDIAQGAGLSRTALYLHYRNKEEIFRSLAHACFEQAVLDMQEALARPETTVEHALMACFVAKDGKFMEVVLATPHGGDVLDPGFAVSGDLAAAGEARMAEVLTDWFADLGVPADIGPANALADTVMAALKGLKASARTMSDLRAGEARLAALVARALA